MKKYYCPMCASFYFKIESIDGEHLHFICCNCETSYTLKGLHATFE